MNQKELRKLMRALPDLPAASSAWDRHRQSIRKHARTEYARDVLKWSTIQATMFVGNAPYIEGELTALRTSGDWRSQWRSAIADSGFGGATCNNLANWSSGNYIHQAYFLNRFEDDASIDVSKFSSIVEIGGGYGAMRAVLANLGFEGEYGIYDLPELSLVQQYYLSHVLDDEQLANTQFYTKCTELPSKTDLIIAISSLSEMPTNQRTQLLVACHANRYLFFTQPSFFGVNNLSYFLNFTALRSDLDWKIYNNPLKIPSQFFVTGYPK